MLLTILFQLLGLGAVADDAMTQAAAMHAAKNYSQAATLYAQVASKPGPWRLEAMERAGESLEAAQQPGQALETYNRLLALDGKCYWAEIAFARKAELAFKRGDAATARQCIGTLKEMFPDSPWSVCAKVTEAKLSKGDVARAEAEYAKEMQAFQKYQTAIGISNVDARLKAMEDIIAAYPETATVTRAHQSKAHLLWRKELKEETIAQWLIVLERTAKVAPKSYIVTRTRLRLGELYRKYGKLVDADALFEAVMASGPGSEVAAKAAYCRIAIDFGKMRVDRDAGRAVGDQATKLVGRCRALAADKTAGSLERARAAMLPLEILSWGGQSAEAVRAAEDFIRAYSGTEYKDEVAMAHFYAGWELKRAGRSAEALPHFQEVIRMMAGRKSLFKTDSIVRSYFNVWRILQETKAPKESVQAAAQALLTAFPDSSYAEAVRHTQMREEQ